MSTRSIIVLVFLLALVLVALFRGAGEVRPVNGEIGYFESSPDLETLWVAIDEKSQSELTNASTAKNDDAVKQMIPQGRVLIVPRGKKVTVVNRGFVTTSFRFMEGNYEGRRGVTPMEFFHRRK